MKRINSIFIFLCLIFMVNKGFAQPGVGSAPYCLPIYFMTPCNQAGACNAPGNFINDFINSFNTSGAVTNIVNNNSCCNSQIVTGIGQRNYRFWGCEHYMVANPGQVITCNFQSGNIYSQGFALFVDWNQNNVFDLPGERLIGTAVPPAATFISGTFTVPIGQAGGTYRMRVRCIWATNGAFIDPCNTTTYGECEDYNLYIPPSMPAGAITATASVNSPICSGSTANFSIATTYTGALTYTWTGPNAFTSSLATPAIPNAQVNASGIYTVVISPGQCPITKTVNLAVNPTPTVVPSSNSPVCQNTPLSLSVAAVPGGTLVTYNWTGPGSYTSAFQNPIIPVAQPSNSGVYSVQVVNSFSNGGVCMAGNTTTAGVVPVNPTNVTPNFTLCMGDQLNLTANNAVPPTAYMWSGPNNFTSALQNPSIPNTAPIHAGNYIVTASFAVQGITLVCTSTAVSNVSIVATSPITLTLPNNICQHNTAFLTATTNPMAPNFLWTGPNGFIATSSNTNIVDISPSATGLYNVVATWAIGTKSCSINAFNVINVVPVSPIAVNAPTAVCYPENVQLTSSSPGAISYSWASATGFTSSIPNPILGAPGTTATGIYTVFTAYTNGALMCYNSNTTQVTINPIIKFDLEPYKQMCYNATYSVSGPAGGTSYLWTGPNGFTNTNQVLLIPSMQTPLAGTYSLEVTLGPCKTYGSTKVEVLSPISFTRTPGNKVVCRGDSIPLIAGASGGSHNYAYVWNPQQWLGSPTGSVQYGHPDGTTIYNVTAYDIACPFYTIGASFTVNVNKAPEPQIELPSYEGCQPMCVKLNSQTQNNAASIVYDFGNGKVYQGDDFTYCLDEAGIYNLKIKTIGKNGCAWTFDHHTPITVNPMPGTDFTSDPELITTANNNVTFYPTNRAGNVTSYLWTFSGTKGNNGNDTSGTKNPARLYDRTGNYPVMLISTTDKGCVDSILKVIEVRDEFSMFIPNSFTPNGDNLNDIFNVKGVGMKADGFSMDIYDRWGSLIYSTKDVNKGWDGTVKGIMAENGTYVFKVKANGANGEGRKEYVGHVSLMK
ncbi:MAG TPA: gliding motility-associated C-terminal domain-containing protein [Bacteroidia bacterium]|nr:gliding motility-associated C-terminal domain-containing protein [Bacteroidia bacterium]